MMALLRRVGMQTRLFFMLAPPAECREHLEETLAFALELDPDFAMFTPTVPLPGAALYEELLHSGCGVPDYDHQLQNFQEILYAPPPFTIERAAEFPPPLLSPFLPAAALSVPPVAAELMNWDSLQAQRGSDAGSYASGARQSQK